MKNPRTRIPPEDAEIRHPLQIWKYNNYHRIVNALIAAISAALLFWLCQRLVQNRWISFGCLLIWGFLPSLIYFDSVLNKSTLGILVIFLLLYTALDIYKWPNRYYHPIKGFMIGILVSILFLLQGNTFLYGVVIFGYLAFFSNAARADKFKTIVAATLVIAAALVYNQAQTNPAKHKYPWALPQKGIHFYIGFHESANGTYHKVKHIPPWPYGHAFHTRMQAESELKRRLTPKEVDRYYLEKGLSFIRNNPSASFKQVLNKFHLFFNNYEIKGVDCLYYLKKQSRLLAWTPFGLGILVTLSGMGLLWLVKQRAYAVLFLILGLLTAMLAANILGFVTWRYRLHNTIPLIILAAYGIQHFCTKTAELHSSAKPLPRRLLLYLSSVIIPLTICGWLAYSPVLTGYKNGYLKRAAANDHLSQKAQKRIQLLEKLDLSNVANDKAEQTRAIVLSKLHRHTQSYQLLKQLIANEHYDYTTLYRYTVYLLWLGDYEEAADIIKKAKTKMPGVAHRLSERLRRPEKMVFDLFVKPYI
jgi:hypothetical protein